MLTSRERWFADVLQAGLDTRLLPEAEILVHVTPAVLAQAMPRDVLVRMFDSALTAGTLSPEAILQTITPALLAEFVAPDLVWECLVAAAERAAIVKGTDDKRARELLRRAVESALETGVLTPAHLLRHADAKILVNHLPDDLTAQLIESGLAAGLMTPALILDVIGVEPLTTHAPTNVIWECLAEVGEGLLLKGEVSAPALGTLEVIEVAAPAPSVTPAESNGALAKRIMMDYMDDDLVSLQVTDDEAPEPDASAIPAASAAPRPRIES